MTRRFAANFVNQESRIKIYFSPRSDLYNTNIKMKMQLITMTYHHNEHQKLNNINDHL